jgi:hypothetical protein
MGLCLGKLFDANSDGKVTAKEVFETIEVALHLVSKAAMTAQQYVALIEAAGVDTKGTLDILQKINAVIAGSIEVKDKLQQIKIPANLEELGDVDEDGDFDKDDVITYLASSQKVVDTLLAADVQSAELAKYRDDIEKIIKVIRDNPPQHKPIPLRAAHQ